jgi:hypothetical protein
VLVTSIDGAKRYVHRSRARGKRASQRRV